MCVCVCKVLLGFRYWCYHCGWWSMAEICSRSDCFVCIIVYILYKQIVAFIILSILNRTYIHMIFLLPRRLFPKIFVLF